MMKNEFPKILILGSTGSVGEQALEVAAACGIAVRGICANRNWRRVAEQARAFHIPVVAMSDESAARELRAALAVRVTVNILTALPSGLTVITRLMCSTCYCTWASFFRVILLWKETPYEALSGRNKRRIC